jgi:SAM-dependent methyltransferase
VSAAPPLSPMATLRWSVVRGILKQLQPRRVLEIGCGQGGFGARLATRYEYVGVEPDEQSSTVARDRIEPVGGQVLYGTSDLIPEDDRFDLVCAFEVIAHLEDDADALVDWSSRVAPGGAILVSVPAWPVRYGPMDKLVGHYRRYTPEQLDEVLRKTGATDVWHVLYGWPLGYLLEAVRNRIAQRRGTASEDSMQARSATSGRLLQPKRAAGAVVGTGVAPFTVVQRLRPTTGTGAVGVARFAPGEPPQGS